MTAPYLTLAGSGEYELIVQKSRFLGYAAPCRTEEEALSFMQQRREEHRSATHHCYAYIIGENAGITRYSDNGEPAGTAGMPILDVLKNKKLVYASIVVVRYFGGTLLGTGGLVRAYGQCALKAVEAAGVECMEWTCSIPCETPYPMWDRIRHAAESLPVQIGDVGYGASVTFSLLVREKDMEHCLDTLRDASARTIITRPAEEGFRGWPMTT